jgi:hypothetical protein
VNRSATASSTAPGVPTGKVSGREPGARLRPGQARTSLSDFVRRKALEAAEMTMLEQPVVVIPAQDWEAFEAWADRPPEKIAGLEELARTDPAWRK